MIDLWADENEPEIHYWSKVYLVRIPHQIGRRTREGAAVYVEVDPYGVLNILQCRSWWFEDDLKEYKIQREIYDWLVEWELAEWKQIGPEDSEIFATEKLTKES